MKIHKLSLNNIASLAGHHTIDFDNISETSNIFAITGKTGSGKSTLLNAISLALYGNVYKTSTISSDYITLGKELGEIDVIYSTGLLKYKASWKLRIKKKNGEFLKKPQLTRSFFKIHESHNVPIEKTPEEILGLSFNQFCKTSILNQGEFSRFLNSKFTERKEILEKLYEGENLERLNSTLKYKIKLVQEEVEKTKNLIGGINESLSGPTLTKKEIKIKNENLIVLKDELRTLKTLVENGKDIEDLTKVITQNESRLIALKTELIKAQERHNTVSKQKNELETTHTHKKDYLNKRKPFLIEAISKWQKLKSYKEQLESSKINLKELETEVKKNKVLKEELDISRKTKQTRKEKAIELYPFFFEIDHADFEFCFNKCLEVTSYASKVSKEIILLENSILGIRKRLNQLEQENLITKKAIVTLNSKLILKPGDIREKIENIKIVKTNLQNIYKNYDQTNSEVAKTNKNLSQRKSELTSITAHITLDTKELNLLESEIKISNLSETITILIEESIHAGECSLCGQATPHAHNFNQRNSTIKNELHEKVNILENKIQTAIKIENQYKLEIKNLDYQKSQLSKQLTLSTQEYKSKIDSLNSMIEGLDNSVSDLNIGLIEHELDSLQSVLRQQETLKEQLNSEQNLLETKNQLIIELSASLARHEQDLQRQNQFIEETTLEIEELTEQYEIFNFRLDKIKNINQHRVEYKKINHDLQLIEKDKNHVTKALGEASEKILELNSYICKIQENIIGLESYISNNNIPDEPGKHLKQLEEEYQIVFHQLSGYKDSLKEMEILLAEIKSKKNSYSEQVHQTTLLRNGHISKFTELIKELKLSQIQLKFENLQELLAKLALLTTDNFNIELFELSLVNLLEIKVSLEDSYQSDRDSLVRDENNYKLLIANKEKIKGHENSLKSLEARLNKLSDLNALIGKDEFRNYVLSIIENNLITQTNEELKLLCQGRYYLCQTNKSNKMASEFLIIDHFRDSLARKVATLSGGETFLVSLAMAMALAELTRGSTQIDSLFIDEGFGTLDYESINEVYDLLQNIQLSGKQLGIISHITGLTSRIPVNIHLDKNQNGLSDISVLLN